ncbi:hypothetical protein CAB38_04815 [Xanthomonas citri pv. punicae]|nr:hypothetical protein CAB38_04815 [Xanthomonas citri pv. punicae]UIE42587.1 hypothetical protein FICKIIDM_01695 [Xanthomonas citri pv. punicae]
MSAPHLPEPHNSLWERSTLCQKPSLRFLYIEDLAPLIGKTPSTIRTFVSRRDSYQHLIPPPYKLPGSRRLVWYEDDVAQWLAATTPVFPPPKRRGRGRPTKREQLERQRWAASEGKGDST